MYPPPPSLSYLAPIQIAFNDCSLNDHCQIVKLNRGNFPQGCDNEYQHSVNVLPPVGIFVSLFVRTLDSRILSAETSSHVPFFKITFRFDGGFQAGRHLSVFGRHHVRHRARGFLQSFLLAEHQEKYHFHTKDHDCSLKHIPPHSRPKSAIMV